jgi:F0F1-type ATP synthase membrane subunit c/vacuolar-type H+-ATPase subunit K
MVSVALAAGLGVLGCSGPSVSIPEAESFDQALATAAEQDAVVLLDFYTDW